MDIIKETLKRTSWNSIFKMIIFVIVGVILVCIPKDVENLVIWLIQNVIYNATLLKAIIGIWLMYKLFVKVNSAVELKDSKNKVWILLLVLAIIMFVGELYSLINLDNIIIIIGRIMIIHSIVDIIENIIIIKHIDEVLDDSK